MAVSSTTDILTLQTNTYQMADDNNMIAGYYRRGLEQVHMRGGRNAEVAFMIDGMQVTNLLFGGQGARINPLSLSEMVVMAGGMSAEFGNAMSGVVNMVTREGGSRYDANAEFMTSELTGADQDALMNMNSLTGYLGGPVPMVDQLTFFASASASGGRDFLVKKDGITYDVTPTSSPSPNIEYDATDPYRQVGADSLRIHPMDIYSGWLGYDFDNRWDGMLNLTYKLSPSMKVNFSGSTNGRWSMPWDYSWRYGDLFGIPENVQEHWKMGTLREGETDMRTGIISGTGGLWAENEQNILYEDNYRAAFIWTHQLNQSTFYSARGSYYRYDRQMRSFRWVNDDGYLSNRDFYYVAAGGDTLWRPDDPMHEVQLRYIPHSYYNEGIELNRTYGYLPWYYVAGVSTQGTGRYWTDHIDQTRTLKADVTSQVSTHHQVKSGVLYNDLGLYQNDLQILWYDPPYGSFYSAKPWEIALYFQDKIEYDFLILNVGLRYDAANAGEVPYWNDPRDPTVYDPSTGRDQVVLNPFLTQADWDEMTPAEQARFLLPPKSSGSVRSQFSPRFGVSHPVTDQAVVYFNYGHFFQNPVYRNLYLEGTLEDAIPIVGNPGMQNEKTVSYEFGYKHQFTDLYALEVTLWARDTSNMVGSELIPAFYGGIPNPYEYSVLLNYDYASSKGFDLSLIKRYSDFYSARVNYSFMNTQSNRDDPWQGYRDDHSLESSPKRPRVLGWDQPHRVSAQVSASVPEGAGPEVYGVRPLENLNASLIYRADAGRPYTPQTKEKSLETNSGRRPWIFQWDLRLYRDFESFGLRYSLFADVRNLFNRKNVLTVFARTGKPDDPGPGATSYSDNYDRWDYYGTPRRINLGIRIFF